MKNINTVTISIKKKTIKLKKRRNYKQRTVHSIVNTKCIQLLKGNNLLCY